MDQYLLQYLHRVAQSISILQEQPVSTVLSGLKSQKHEVDLPKISHLQKYRIIHFPLENRSIETSLVDIWPSGNSKTWNECLDQPCEVAWNVDFFIKNRGNL